MQLLSSSGGFPERKITVQTFEGNDIDNLQTLGLSTQDKETDKIIVSKYSQATPRTGPSAAYNCHGLTFASRRSKIWKKEELDKIIAEDKYTWIERKDVLPGDIILYIDDMGDISHSGLIISKDLGLGTFQVVSKWGIVGREFIHMSNYCPYVDGTIIRFLRTSYEH